jgi:hypothetical protein
MTFSLPQLPKRGPGRPRTQAPKIRTTLITNDYHLPDVDIPTLKAVGQLILDLQPDYHIINGDFLDCYEQSKYEKDPRVLDRTRQELEMANEVLDEFARLSPSTITKIVFGNHEKRLTHRLFDNPDLLAYVTKTGDPNEILAAALSLDERGIAWYGYPDSYNHFGFLLTHGQAVGVHPALKELQRYGVPGCSGHVHRNAYAETKTRRGHGQWWSLGGLCRDDMAYLPVNNWVRGIGILLQIVGSEDEFSFHPVTIVGGRFIFNSKLYCQDGAFDAA